MAGETTSKRSYRRVTEHSQNAPIFTKKFIQPSYNPKARYLPISQKWPPHKSFNESDLQKSQNLRTDSMDVTGWGLALSNAHWLKCRNEDASKKIFVAIGILVFDFELFIGHRWPAIYQLSDPGSIFSNSSRKSCSRRQSFCR